MKIDKAHVQQRFIKAKQSYTEHAVAQQKICLYLFDLIQKICPKKMKQVFEVGCGSGNLTHLLQHRFDIAHYIINDLYPEVMDFIPQPVTLYLGDAEEIDFPQYNNMVVSSSALQWMQNLEQVFQKIQHSISLQGWLCFSIFGQDNLKEIKALTGQGLKYPSKNELCILLEKNGFEVLHHEEQHIVLDFLHPHDVLKHLKATGVTATSSDFRWTKKSLQDFYSGYEEFSLDNQRYPITYHPIYIIARRTT